MSKLSALSPQTLTVWASSKMKNVGITPMNSTDFIKKVIANLKLKAELKMPMYMTNKNVNAATTAATVLKNRFSNENSKTSNSLKVDIAKEHEDRSLAVKAVADTMQEILNPNTLEKSVRDLQNAASFHINQEQLERIDTTVGRMYGKESGISRDTLEALAERLLAGGNSSVDD